MAEAKTEQKFMDEKGVTVTNARVIVPGQTFAMSGVTSVKVAQEKPKRTGPVILIVLGIFLCFGYLIGGIILLSIGVAWFIMQKTQYYVGLQTSSGEAKAFISTDRMWIEKIVNAINEAIIARG
jgi:hypothetical protein